jgi:hypothetical protein
MAPRVNGSEYQAFSNISANTAAFTLLGGQYAIQTSATFGGGSVTLQRLSLDGSTYVNCLAAFTAAGYATVNLPPGTYRFTIATATAVYAELLSIVEA